MSNINYNPLEDGITHLNAYSNANTELGRFCSNFAYCPIETEDGHFDSVEGYWGWLGVFESNPQRDELRNLSGYQAKLFKDKLFANGDIGRKDPEFQRKIRDAIHIKFQTKQARDLMNKYKELLSLPLCHYYTFGGDNGKVEIKDVTNDYPEFVNSVKEELDSYLKEQNSMFGVCKGIICQQVNCQDVMGAGLAKAIMDKYPIVSNKYHESFTKNSKESLFGKIDIIPIGEDFYVANIYSQFNYGNPSKTGKIYTDADKLVRAVDAICKKYSNLPVYLPHTKNLEGKEDYGIGCGYGGERWSRLSMIFSDLNHKNLHLLDTQKGVVHEFDNKIFGEDIINKYEHIESKYPKCKGLSLVGQKMLQYQNDIAYAYNYKPLPDNKREESLLLYLGNLPEEFMGNKRTVPGGLEIEGKNQPLYLKDGTKLANKYGRIVVGHYGAFIEIDKNDIEVDRLTTRKGEEYRESDKYNVKYYWKTIGDTEAKIYEQVGGVDYADYKPGKYYISPYEVMGKDEIKKLGLKWEDKFAGFLVEKSANQIKPNIDKSLYEGKAVVFDMETTGFSVDKGDEPLQISIVNEDCMTILNTYLKPYHKIQWKSAQMVNHISPLMVQNSPHLDEYSDFLQEVFDKASVVVGHNVSFDIKFVEKCGKIEINKEKVFDTMKYFKKDEPEMKHKLDDAIKHYCPEAYHSYSNGAHNAYYDTIATTKVYNAIVEKMLENDVIDRG